MTIRLVFRGIQAAIREIERYEREIERIHWRTLTRAARDVSRLYARTIQSEIDRTTIRRTGRLRAVKVRIARDRRNGLIRFVPQFPRTMYNTPFGRGRRGASKMGQYAFVLNRRKQFIQQATRRVQQSAALDAILEKHLRFIINQVNQGR